MRPIRLMTLEPGHFHAALVQKQMVPGIHPRVHVYSVLNDDLLTHLARIVGFNSRADSPTNWELDVRAGANAVARCFREQPGNTVVIAGRNKPKIDLILGAVANGLHVVADKPWIIDFDDFAKLEQVFYEADLRELIVRDVMTERFEITNILQRELMRDGEIFGTQLVGSVAQPGLLLESVHYLKKHVAGVPLQRPAWWFDVTQAGEAIADVGTHLADLAMGLLFPEQPIDYKRHIELLNATTSPTILTPQQFHDLTAIHTPNEVHYHGNGTITYKLRGVHVRISNRWEQEAQTGSGDSHESIARGSLSQVVIRPVQTTPELFVIPNDPAKHKTILAKVTHRCQSWQGRWQGIRVRDLGDQIQLEIPAALRVGHEQHFAEVLTEFVTYFHTPRQIPVWERPNLLAKYYLTTKAVELAKQKQ